MASHLLYDLRPGFAGNLPARRLGEYRLLGPPGPGRAAHHTVILMDSRGHGRSTRDARPYGYDLMADDVVALMNSLKVAKADIVGWSDGAILGIDLAMRHKDKLGKVFAFAANTMTSGVKDGVEKNPTFAAFIERAGHEYSAHSATPKQYASFVEQISRMWANSQIGAMRSREKRANIRKCLDAPSNSLFETLGRA